MIQKSLLLAGLCMLLLSTSCQSEKKKHEKEIEFLVTNPIKIDTTITKDYVCQIHSIRNIEVRALEKGYLKTIYVDEGQSIKKGQKMFDIMPNVYQADLQKAKAEADVAQIEYQNTKMLADEDVISQNELNMAKAKLEKANAEVSLAQTHLGFTNIKAPFDGIMGHLHVRGGSLLDEGELLTTLSDNSKMWVYYNVSEAEYLDFITNIDRNKDQEVSLLMANNRVFPHKGIVETIEGEFNNQTGNIAFRAVFTNEEGILRHGETGSILMEVPFKDAIIIPQKATFEVLDKKYVFVIDENNTVKQQEITLRGELPQLFVVDQGLSVQDKILLEGIRMVKNGEKIHYKVEDGHTVIKHLEMYAE
ncbi:efflux RND transporter periplasmic adaptor subunit [Tamlana sp. s12]|nr:efflux RND transporter periplasmic adaptor subunit [Tamlana sp. s12]QQY82481.1 efflux RND transporter periplasmic adaptor subunit [Tamlana sp. s12]